MKGNNLAIVLAAALVVLSLINISIQLYRINKELKTI